MKSFLVVTTTLMLFYGCQGQYKNTGIKTRYPSPSSGNLILGNATEHNETNHYVYSQQPHFENTQPQYNTYDRYNGNFKPAEYYLGGAAVPTVTRPPVVLDATAEFINKTRSAMASGICYTEVPTASLVHGSGIVPVGNGTRPEMSKIQVCCEGYERNPHVFKRCDPICDDDCPNGICTAPNTCVCMPGHVRNENNKCITTCPIGCGNGVCGDNNECRCKPGYTLEPVQQKYCVPLCEPACQFGKCVSPNKCACQDGYRLTASGVCEPHCENCDNGKCTSPGYCTCNTGYIKVGAICEPVCSRGCDKGRCIAPDTCSCEQGYEMDHTGTKCVPHCDVACLNGVCGGNNKCVCNSGYVPDELQPNMCKPHCPLGCPNGFCTSPNFCICKPGFIKTGIKGRQSCTPI
ncbi:von Willebrand factor D and EGF domain-containing protein [Lucilia cuprina]|nr:von Willebrand factor D and EGF domain-containing protein [Lucilia cuprina]